MVKFSCKICTKAVASNHRAIQCDICDIWVHVKCNKMNSQTYYLLRKDNTIVTEITKKEHSQVHFMNSKSIMKRADGITAINSTLQLYHLWGSL